jgi:tRNA dimethylallyltransferase
MLHAIAIVGPTASGKSRLAMAIAARLPVEIVSIDSAQVYRDMNVGTAKPSAEERRAVPHHLIDLIDPTQAYSAAHFRRDALAAIAEITQRGRLPLLVGGTMLYLKALREGLSALPSADPTMRAALDREAAKLGWPTLHEELARVDPATAARLKPFDAQRIQRALEVFRLTGKPLSALQGEREQAAHALRLTTIGLMAFERVALHTRIAARFDAMLEAELVEELTQLRARYALHEGLPSMRCVGYRQAWQFLEGEIDRQALRATGIAATRQLAKRQITWMRAMADAAMLDYASPRLLDECLARISEAAPVTV